ncbi:response regulator receiver domain-containing protein [Winogradskyella pacifica]|uniref:Response regulator receiver domain-containing protein n=1 Tax=Winogradskyella pacifica TaxID=664642 RepID=A0A3D9N121_9FLAO|nr:response regulator [Winogradskyella pacifica]REE25417.1 response regulator receiver domain-containing protein [Winogradskyella pacifica]
MRKIDLACIVEDDPMHLFITKKYMELSGFVEKILVCKNGKEAYDTLKAMFLNSEKLPQIIFLDLNMPIWDGWQFLDEFTKIPIEQKVIIYILTSSNSEEDIKRAEQYSLKSNYLIKPINQGQLKSVLEELVNN